VEMESSTRLCFCCVYLLLLQAWDQLLKYSHSRIKHVLEDYKEIFEALPFPDKKR